MQYVFGSGLLYAQPDGADTGAVTPMQIGALRGVSVDMGFNAKDLHGGPWPLAIGRGTGKVACSAEYAQLTAEGFNLLFFGGPTPAVGSTRVAVEEAHTVTGNAITPQHAATYELDLGVVAALPSGDLFHRVEAAPGPRQYTCNESTGAYGFGGSNGQDVLVSYAYADAANGRRIDLPNRNIGHTPRFSVVLTETFNGKAMTLRLNSCAASRLGFTSKTEDFTIPSFSFSAAADDAGIVGSLSVEKGAPTSNGGNTPSGSFTVDLSALTNAGTTPAVGITVSGLNPLTTYLLTEPSGRLYTAWLPQVAQLWKNQFSITTTSGTALVGSNTGVGEGYATAADARAAFPGATISGFSSYTFWIYDSPVFDNQGGISILATPQ